MNIHHIHQIEKPRSIQPEAQRKFVHGQQEADGYHRYRPNNNNIFDSPNLSTSSINDSNHSDTSWQDEFHLDKYSHDGDFNHLRQLSTSNVGEKDNKPELNVITNFSGHKMPMEPAAVIINAVRAKRVQADRRQKGISVVSQEAIPSAVSPSAEGSNMSISKYSGLKRFRLGSESKKLSHRARQLHTAGLQSKTSPLVQRIPIGITIPKADAALIEHTASDSAFPITTPMTPAIVITPAGTTKPWVLQNQSREDQNQQLSNTPLVVPGKVVGTGRDQGPTLDGYSTTMSEKVMPQQLRMSEDSSVMILAESADTGRPKSQGWWNLMLSPLLRAGSIASRKGPLPVITPPVPPLPFASAKDELSAVSARSDPSLIISASETSPDTPRRQGLASVRTSTWSRWTEWEEERNASSRGNLQVPENLESQNLENFMDRAVASQPSLSKIGLAAEYFHACAVEASVGRAYYDCVGHSCVEQLPKLQSIHDDIQPLLPALRSPFKSPLHGSRHTVNDPDMLLGSPTDVWGNLSPDELSPNVRQANIASVVKAKALDIIEDKETSIIERGSTKETTIIRASPNVTTKTSSGVSRSVSHSREIDNDPYRKAPATPETKVVQESESQLPVFESRSKRAAIAHDIKVFSPSAVSPESQRQMAPIDGVPMSGFDQRRNANMVPSVASDIANDVAKPNQLPTRPAFVSAETEYPTLSEPAAFKPVTAADIASTHRRLVSEKRRQRHEDEDNAAKKIGGLWRGRGCFSSTGCMGRRGTEHRTKRRWVCLIVTLLLAIVVTSIALAVTLTRHGDQTPIDSQWLNLTGYPPMPTGLSTIAAPNLAGEQKQCVQPTTMWSCSVPKEDRDKIGSNDANEPNFRFEIKFRNGTVPANMTIPLPGQHTSNPKTSGDPFTNDLFVANPLPPNQADQVFIGDTTDNVTTPFDGEKTPFYITFISAFPQIPSGFNNSSSRKISRRQSNNSLIEAIPPAAKADDGSAAPAALLPASPYPISQPVKLYNRGLVDEHYGFYSYYDKSIYLSAISIVDDAPVVGSNNPIEADQDGGSSKSQANVVCTFAETRFLFKIYTNPTFGGSLLTSDTSANLTHPDDVQSTSSVTSATDFRRPGSFPYPASIVVDRHGGDIDNKAIYCYGMQGGRIIDDAKFVNGEFRSFGGELINAAPTVVDGQSDFNRTAGGIDGGTGGCFCNWQNFR